MHCSVNAGIPNLIELGKRCVQEENPNAPALGIPDEQAQAQGIVDVQAGGWC